MDPHFLLRAGIDPHGSIPRDYLTEGGITKCILLESLAKKKQIGLFYVLEYIRAMIPKGHIEDESLNLLRIQVESDLKEVTRTLLHDFAKLFAEWIADHTAGFYFVSYLFYGLPEKARVDYDLTWAHQNGKSYAKYKGRGFSAEFEYDSTKQGYITRHFNQFKSYFDRLNRASEVPDLQVSDWDDGLAVNAMVVGYIFAGERTQYSDDFAAASDRTQVDEVLGIYNYAFYNRLTVPQGHVLSHIVKAYWGYLEKGKWKGFDLSKSFVVLSHLLNIVHHSGGMYEYFADTGDDIAGLTPQFLDKMSSLDDHLPEGSDFKTLSYIYNNWSRWI